MLKLNKAMKISILEFDKLLKEQGSNAKINFENMAKTITTQTLSLIAASIANSSLYLNHFHAVKIAFIKSPAKIARKFGGFLELGYVMNV